MVTGSTGNQDQASASLDLLQMVRKATKNNCTHLKTQMKLVTNDQVISLFFENNVQFLAYTDCFSS